MFISPKTAIEEGWVKFPEWMSEEQQQKCIQPNALDFTVDRLFVVDRGLFIINEDKKRMRGGPELEAKSVFFEYGTDPFWELQANEVYDGMSDFYVTVPEKVAAMLIVRSTFNRNGIFLTSGLYDSGFKGNIGFAIHNRSGGACMAPHTRIGQIMFVHSESVGQYTGGYNTKEGQHWTSSKNANLSSYDAGVTAKVKK